MSRDKKILLIFIHGQYNFTCIRYVILICCTINFFMDEFIETVLIDYRESNWTMNKIRTLINFFRMKKQKRRDSSGS